MAGEAVEDYGETHKDAGLEAGEMYGIRVETCGEFGVVSPVSEGQRCAVDRKQRAKIKPSVEMLRDVSLMTASNK